MLLRLLVMMTLFSTACVLSPLPDAGMDVTFFDGGTSADRVSLSDMPRDAVLPQVDVVLLDGGYMDGARLGDVSLSDAPASAIDANLCSSLAEQYLAAVRQGQTCSTRADCGQLVCETLCCNCQVYVSDGTARQRIDQLSLQWRTSGCALQTTCIAIQCARPVGAECSSMGRCTTLRSGGD